VIGILSRKAYPIPGKYTPDMQMLRFLTSRIAIPEGNESDLGNSPSRRDTIGCFQHKYNNLFY
jgi:hypothetical protein